MDPTELDYWTTRSHHKTWLTDGSQMVRRAYELLIRSALEVHCCVCTSHKVKVTMKETRSLRMLCNTSPVET